MTRFQCLQHNGAVSWFTRKWRGFKFYIDGFFNVSQKEVLYYDPFSKMYPIGVKLHSTEKWVSPDHFDGRMTPES